MIAEQLGLRPLNAARAAINGVIAYCRKIGTVSHWFAKDSAGVEYQLTGGSLVTAYIADGAISLNGHASLNDVTPALAMTVADPGVAGIDLVISQIDSGTAGHVVTFATAGALDGTNEIATFNAQFETLVLRSVSSTRWVIVENVGAVALST